MRSSSCRILVVRTAPVAPIGWPKEIAPPTGLILSSGIPRSRWTARVTEAKASFASTTSMSSIESPAFFSAIWEAGTMPMPMTDGSTPATAAETSLPATGSPSSSALLALVTSAIPDVLVLGELDGLLFLLDLNRHYLVVEVALIPGLLGALVATCRVLVNLVAAQAVLLGDVLRRNTHMIVVELIPQPIVDHVVQDLGVRQPHPVAVAPLRQQERRHIHVLDAAREDHVRLPECDLLSCRDDRLQTRGTHPVKGHGGGGVLEPSIFPHPTCRVYPPA